MKRGKVVLSVMFLVVLLSMILVVAQFDSLDPGGEMGVGETTKEAVSKTAGIIEDIIKGVEPILEKFLGKSVGVGSFTAGELLFAKVLFLLIILAIIWTALSSIDFINNNKLILWVLSIGATILATRWISTALVPMILLPYSTLGVAIAAGLPFIIYFALVEIKLSGHRYRTVRKIGWIFFAAIFIFLWITRYNEIGNVAWIYPLTTAASLVVLSLDGTINRIISKIKTESATSYINQEQIYVLEDKIREKTKRFADGGYEGRGGNTTYEKEVNALKSQIAALTGH